MVCVIAFCNYVSFIRDPIPPAYFTFICLLIVLEILGMHIFLTLNFGTTSMRQFCMFNLLEFSKHDEYMKQ